MLFWPFISLKPQWRNLREKPMNPVIAGSIAGISGYLGTLPLDFVKQRLQTRSLNFKESHILKDLNKNGMKILFKGGLIGSSSIMPQMAIKFSMNEYLHNRTKNEINKKSTLTPFRNGFIAGYVDGSFLGPILAIQSILQMERSDLSKKTYDYRDAFRILKRVPIIPFTIPLAMRNAAYTSVIFGGQKTLSPKYEETFLNNFLISSALNVPGVIACSPFDVIRAKQIQYVLDKKTNNPFSMAKDIYCHNSIKGFYQGFSSLYLNFAIRFPVTFSIYFSLTRAKKLNDIDRTSYNK